jgi:hypothetical protein
VVQSQDFFGPLRCAREGKFSEEPTNLSRLQANDALHVQVALAGWRTICSWDKTSIEAVDTVDVFHGWLK